MVAGITLAVWHHALEVPFHFDDHHTVVDNLEIRDPGNIWLFTRQFFARGALKIGFALNYMFADRLPGGEPRPEAFHAVNLALHAINAVLAFLLVRAVLMRGPKPMRPENSVLSAAAVALIYALTPLHAMAVNLIASRSETQAALFTLVAINLLVLVTDPQRSRFAGPALAGLALASWFIAVGSKSVAIAAVPLSLLILFLVWPSAGRQPLRRAALVGSVVAGGILVGLVLAREVWQFRYHGMWANLCTQMPVVLHYAWLTIFPAGVSFIHDAPIRQKLDAVSLVSLLLLAIVIVTAVLLVRRRNWLGCGLLWYLIAIAPSSSIVPRTEVMLEYRGYLAVLGLAAALVYTVIRLGSWLAERLRAPRLRGALPAAVLVAWIIVLAIYTMRMNRIYGDAVALWGHAVHMSPDAWMAHSGYGRALYEVGRHAEAVEHYRRSIALKPGYVNNYWNLSAALAARNDLAGAERELQRAMEIAPDQPNVYVNLGVIRRRLDDDAGAVTALEYALTLDPDHPEANYNLADSLSERGQSTRAVQLYENALRIKPTYARAMAGLSIQHARSGRISEALRLADDALTIDPDEPTAYVALADAFITTGRYAQALEALERGLRRAPGHHLLTTRLAWFRVACPDEPLRDPSEAARLAAMMVHRSGGRDPRALDLLAAAHAAAGRFEAAVRTSRKALALLDNADDAWLIQQITDRLESYEAGRPYFLPGLERTGHDIPDRQPASL